MDVDERAFAEPDDEGRKLDTEDKRRPKMANDQNFYRWLQYCRSIPEAKDSPEAVQYMMAQFLHKKEASGLDPWKEFDRVYSRKEGVEPVYPENNRSHTRFCRHLRRGQHGRVRRSESRRTAPVCWEKQPVCQENTPGSTGYQLHCSWCWRGRFFWWTCWRWRWRFRRLGGE